MASEAKHTRRRTNSNAVLGLLAGHGRGQSRHIPQPKSSHTTDEFLQEFLNPAFDPAAYLNASLPPLSHKMTSASVGADAVPLAELSTQAQTLLSQLNAHTTRLSNTLTQLTDDILRSGSRLAYQVELLRGETLSMTETMNDTLRDEIAMFIPEGLNAATEAKAEVALDNGSQPKGAGDNTALQGGGPSQSANDPEYIKQLQTLTLVRSRLESVIKTFGDAMEFVFPPSEVSVSSSFLSVSAPEPGSQQQSSEEKGQQVLQQIRDEIAGTLNKAEDPIQGIEKAAQRVEQLKELTRVWKDTAEEKGRTKFIESLAKMVEDKHKELMKEMEQAARRDARGDGTRPRKSSVSRDAAVIEESKALPGGFGLISQLQRLRTGL
ncbi:hypothetical protein HJFPF1_06398 [Paramyrothecium foliicola]|nr:hypothetical protein HJFPF1_06398 [Paramyrothecium foliicola]